MSMRFDCLVPDGRAEGLQHAVAAIGRGDLVVLPTDTVYGIGADAFRPSAVDALLAAKGRGRDMPVPVLVSSAAMLEGVVDQLPGVARELVDAFWPGALTLVLRHTVHLSWDLGDTQGTVAVRMPLHPLALDLITQTGPLAVSSANRSGAPAATTADDARAQLGDTVEVYLDGGASPGPVPSSIVDVTGAVPHLLREGAVSPEALRTVVPDLLLTR
ncbi:MAG: L-threonylcarbamoyladenylate synthase [Actinomycetota bacterium]|nr:L-threonylcarbamoyladenylate synthase [Actinomycetota bacterium]